MGYKSGDIFDSPRFYSMTGRYWYNNFRCNGNEPVLDLCQHGNWTTGSSRCYDNHGIYCYGSVRLSSKYSNSSGALLVYEDTEYKTVCGDDFDQNAVNVVCRELGFPTGGRILPANNFNIHRSSTNTRYICTGYEASLMDCSTDDSSPYCATSITTISCFTGGNYTDQGQDGDTMINDIRQVLVYKNGLLGTICPEQWGGEETEVACREAGYQHGYASPYYGESSKPMWLSTVECNGTETSLRSCRNTEFNSNSYCPSHAFAGVYCYNDDDLNQFRLVDGDKSNNGLIQVKYQNTWNYFCDSNGIYDTKAKLICKQMGYKSGDIFDSPRFDNMTGRYWYNNFRCNGNEPVLDLCQHGNWTTGSSRCYDNHGIYCYGSVRLSSKYSNSSGALLVYEDTEYKTVCGDNFDQNAVSVVCRELGFPAGGRILPGNSFNVYCSSTNKRYICTGNEASLMDCVTDDSSAYCATSITTISCFTGGNSTGQGTVGNNHNTSPNYSSYTPYYTDYYSYSSPNYYNSYSSPATTSTSQSQSGNMSMIENELVDIRSEAAETVNEAVDVVNKVDVALRNIQN
ncbi:scavenger receptor cysteine-rich type 1 protein M130 [Patella vulgata]|uniref:scavenger receptor cysteine-rich type 1 protein M130 n=1 Tax=Patella vulgata TaxID=6465 RepID=UPI0024A95342|nr:scavenger receptor cysteine-rich type 1 protein M130 [Patella vulgata]